MDDLISRQAAIDICEKISGNRYLSADGNIGAEMCAERIAQLPSAQPEIIRCKDCKHWTIHKRLEIPWCRVMHIDRGANCFCSDAERRTDGM